MSRFWNPAVNSLDPYVPGEQPRVHNLIKLNTNEHPLPPSPRVFEAIARASQESLRLYPDPRATELTRAIAKHYGLDSSNVFVGNGSDEVLAHVFYGLLKQDHPLLLPDLTYGFYPTYCRLYDIKHVFVPLDEQFQIRAEDYFPENVPQTAGAIIFANPNAPTGRKLELEQVKKILQANPDIPVVVDEAYVDFGAQSSVALLADHPNLLVVHTFSKSRSLAGLRVGYAMGSADLIEGLERVKNSFNSYPLDALAQAGALAAMEDDAYFESACRHVMQTRDVLTQSLLDIGFEVLPSSTNFVFARHPNHRGGELAAWLRERAILVRHFDKPRISNFLRITVGTPEQCQCLIEALTACVKP